MSRRLRDNDRRTFSEGCLPKVLPSHGRFREFRRYCSRSYDFYPEGGGQPGDSGRLVTDDGRSITIIDSNKGETGINHIWEEGVSPLSVGDMVTAEIDWERRYLHMRIHTALHVLCAHVEGAVTGGSIGLGKGRLDFDIPGEHPQK